MSETANADSAKTETKNDQQNATEDQTAAAPPKEMRAVVLTGFGGLKSVKVMKKPEPVAGEGEVLIRVKACGVNFLDVMLRQGAIDSCPKTPCIMGFECSGEVEAVGPEVTDFQVGDRVAALAEYKAWAELVAVPAKFVYKIPADMNYQEAAALTLHYVVAYALLFDIGNLRKGQSVLIHSAGGGVGQAVAQLCKTVPDVTLIGTAAKAKHESIKDSYTHLIEHGSDYVQEVKKLFPEGVDLVLDCLCGEDANKGQSLLKPLGRYILYGSSSLVPGETKSILSIAKFWWQVDKINPMKLYDENKSTSGFHLRHLLYQQKQHDYVRGIVEKVYKLWQDGKIKPVVDSTWAYEDVAEAMQKLHDRKNIGKLLLDPSMEPKPKPQGKAKDKESKEKDSKPAPVASGESTDTEKDAKEGEPSPPAEN